jgi:hypothetical protein
MQNEDPKNSPATSEFFKDCDRIDQIIPHQPSPDLTITSRGYREINERNKSSILGS